MNSCDISKRNKALLEAYHLELRRARYPIKLSDILENVVKHPADRFYTATRGVYETIKKIRKGEEIILSEERERLINEVIKRVEEEEKKHPEKKLKRIVEEILDSPAPEFYLKPSSAKIIIHHEKKRQRYILQQQTKDRDEKIKKRK